MDKQMNKSYMFSSKKDQEFNTTVMHTISQPNDLASCQRLQSLTPIGKGSKTQNQSIGCTHSNSSKEFRLPPLPSKQGSKRNTGPCLRKLSKIIDTNHILYRKSNDPQFLSIVKENQRRFNKKKDLCAKRWSESLSLSKRLKDIKNKRTGSSLVCEATNKIESLLKKCRESNNFNSSNHSNEINRSRSEMRYQTFKNMNQVSNAGNSSNIICQCDASIESSDSEQDKRKNTRPALLILKRKIFLSPEDNKDQEKLSKKKALAPSRRQVSENDLIKSLKKIKCLDVRQVTRN